MEAHVTHVTGWREQAHLPGREGTLLDELQQIWPVLLTGRLCGTQSIRALQKDRVQDRECTASLHLDVRPCASVQGLVHVHCL
jgi:hypothetical protein